MKEKYTRLLINHALRGLKTVQNEKAVGRKFLVLTCFIFASLVSSCSNEPGAMHMGTGNEKHGSEGIVDYRTKEPEEETDAAYGNCTNCACTGWVSHPDLGRFPRGSDICYSGHGQYRCGYRFDEHDR